MKTPKLQSVALFFILLSAVSLSLSYGFSRMSPSSDKKGFTEFLAHHFNKYPGELLPVNESLSLPINDVASIELETQSADLSFVSHSGEKLEVELKGRAPKYVSPYNPEVTDRLQVNQEGSRLQVRVIEEVEGMDEESSSFRFKMSGNNTHLKVKVKVPTRYSKELVVTTLSGDFKLKQLNLDALKVDSLSGDFRVREFKVNRLEVNTKSGDFDGEDGHIQSVKANLISGDVKLERVMIEDTVMETVSGDVKVDFRNTDPSLKGTTVSGDFSLKVPKNSRIEVLMKSISGDLRNDIQPFSEGSIEGDKKVSRRGRFSLDSVSGDLKVTYQ